MALQHPNKGDALGGAMGRGGKKKRNRGNNNGNRNNNNNNNGNNRPNRPGNGGGGGNGQLEPWNPFGGAAVSAFEGGYFDPNSTYGVDARIVGADSGKSGGGKGRGGKDKADPNPYDGVHSDIEQARSNTDPESWMRTQLAGQGMAYDPSSAFGGWLADQMGLVQDAWTDATKVNKELSFASFLDTLGLPGGGSTADLLRQRWRAALPSQTGYSESANGAGPTRWSVW